MDRKDHWAWPYLTRPGLTRQQLLVHFRHEYLVYVRDFPVLLARALGSTPPIDDVRTSLAENVYEEQTGGISKTAPHPELFLRMMDGLGYSRSDFEDDGDLHPNAIAYRNYLWTRSTDQPWQGAVALLTIFVEGSRNERAELSGAFVRPKGKDAIERHPLVAHYGCPPEAMQLVRVHGDVEGGHREAAWRMVLSHARGCEESIVSACEAGLRLWLAYRDGVAARMNLRRAA
jgi:pyrroloquinoline-quinone synthase